MATLRRVSALLAKQNIYRLGSLSISTSSPAPVAFWNKDWQPGPLPRTPEERAAAAKKYGLRPEDYNLLSDGSVGDYPNLPLVNNAWKDPFENYDIPGLKRNYGEAIHKDFEIMGEDLWDKNSEGKFTYNQIVARFLFIAFTFLGLTYLAQPYPYFLPQMPKQYPFNDLHQEKGGDPSKESEVKHYTFETESS